MHINKNKHKKSIYGNLQEAKALPRQEQTAVNLNNMY